MRTSTLRIVSQLRRRLHRSSQAVARVLVLVVVLGAPARAGATDTDEQIEIAARQSYVFRTFLSEDPIRTKSEDGVVTLTGSVNQDSHRILAEHTLAGLPNVRSVDNQLTIKETDSSTPDAWLHLKVKETLAFHRSVSALHNDVDVKEGAVTLKGGATSESAKALATEFAKDLEGVTTVRNEMIVVEPASPARLELPERIDDASITAQVRMALFSHRSTSTLMASVSTAGGVVTIGGQAATAAERDWVTKLVKDINGVLSVTNEMTLPAVVSITM